jgi:DNA-binding transcriptional regulator YhcF (GntR family)
VPQSFSWLKLYHEILDDPKMVRLPDRLWRRVIECFCFAGRCGNGGSLPSVDDMAWVLRVDKRLLEKELLQLVKTGIVKKTDDGWHVTNFAKRQAPTPATERMAQMRLRQGDGHVTERIPELESESESDKREREGGAKSAPRPARAQTSKQEPAGYAAVREYEKRHGQKSTV